MKCAKSVFLTNNYWVGWVVQSNCEWSSIVDSVNSFNSLIACYLVRIDEQFFRALSKYFSGKGGSASVEKNWPVPSFTYAPPVRRQRRSFIGAKYQVVSLQRRREGYQHVSSHAEDMIRPHAVCWSPFLTLWNSAAVSLRVISSAWSPVTQLSCSEAPLCQLPYTAGISYLPYKIPANRRNYQWCEKQQKNISTDVSWFK